MIDIHSHILPGVDDGAQTEAESIEIAKAAVKEGIRKIIATPHHKNGFDINERNFIIKRVKELNEALKKGDIPLKVLPGQETRIYPEMATDLAEGQLLPLNDSKYIFVEFPFGHVPKYAKDLLGNMIAKGFIPIIVHPERNKEMINKPEQLYDFVNNGALTQLTSASIVGERGIQIERLSKSLINSQLVHFIASDAHNTTNRRFFLHQAYKHIADDFGEDTVENLKQNAERLVAGEMIITNSLKSFKHF